MVLVTKANLPLRQSIVTMAFPLLCPVPARTASRRQTSSHPLACSTASPRQTRLLPRLRRNAPGPTMPPSALSLELLHAQASRANIIPMKKIVSTSPSISVTAMPLREWSLDFCTSSHITLPCVSEIAIERHLGYGLRPTLTLFIALPTLYPTHSLSFSLRSNLPSPLLSCHLCCSDYRY